MGLQASHTQSKGLKALSPQDPMEIEAMDHDENSKPAGQGVSLSSSTGWYSVSHQGVDWRASGSTDLMISYQLGVPIGNGSTFASFRYSPADVSPKQKDSNSQQEFVGILESYLIGVGAVFEIKDAIDFSTGLELGYHVIRLSDQLQRPDSSPPNPAGFAAVAGGEIRWKPVNRVAIGLSGHLGTGSVTTTQLGIRTTFSL